MKKVLSVVLSLLFAFSAMSMLSVVSFADDSLVLTFAAESIEDEKSIEAVDWFMGENGEYYIFVPSNWDASALRVWFNAASAVTLGAETMTSGNVYDLGESGTIKYSGKDYKYNVVSSSGVGTIFIETESGSLDAIHADKEVKEAGKISIYDKKGKEQFVGDLSYIKGRGNQTWEYDKRPYNIKLGEKVKLFGMQKSAKWCLIANYDDTTLSRNAIMYGASADAGLAYSPEYAPADVYINGEYKGSYLVTSKIEASSKRIDVENLDDVNEEVCMDAYGEDFNMDDVERGGFFGKYTGLLENTMKYVVLPESEKNTTNGGYILEMELANRYAAEVSGFVTSRSQPFIMKSPEYASQSQMEFISNYYQRFEDAVFSDDDKNSEGEYYYDLADMTSLCKYYLMSEWASNMDSGLTSTYFYLDTTKDGMLYAGPVWDYDIALGNNSDTRYGLDYNNPEQFTVCFNRQYRNTVFGSWDVDSKPTIYNKLATKDSFVKECKTIWDNEVYAAISEWVDANAPEYIANVKNSAVMNHIRWNTYGTQDVKAVAEKFDADAENLMQFMTKRTAFLNSNLGKVQTYSEDINFVKKIGMKLLTWVNSLFEKFIKAFHLENKI